MLFMARILAFLMAFTLAGVLTSCSGEVLTEREQRPSLDFLFDRLASTRDDVEARMIEATIRRVWARTDRPEIDRLMAQAIAAMHQGDLETAAQALDQVVTAQPDLVAGWNLRATVHYVENDNAAALADLAITLSLEPRHFGAWSGLGLIMLEMGEDRAALRAFENALRYNPHLRDIRQDVMTLRDHLAGQAI